MGEQRGEQRLKGEDAVKHINGNIFNKGQNLNFVNYTRLGQLARSTATVKIDFASISAKQLVQQLAEIVDEIFVRIQRTQIDAKDFTSDSPSQLSSLNAFLLRLAETGLNSEQLSAIKTKYDAKFGQHIALTAKVDTKNVMQLENALGGKAANGDAPTIAAHQKIVTEAQAFNTKFAGQITAKEKKEGVKAKQNEIPDQSDERLNQELEVRNRVGEIWKESLAALQDENDHLARNCLAKLWNKKEINANTLQIKKLTGEEEASNLVPVKAKTSWSCVGRKASKVTSERQQFNR